MGVLSQAEEVGRLHDHVSKNGSEKQQHPQKNAPQRLKVFTPLALGFVVQPLTLMPLDQITNPLQLFLVVRLDGAEVLQRIGVGGWFGHPGEDTKKTHS